MPSARRLGDIALILTCEKCETRFRLDESRLPAKGARVRCSRCKHAFLVKPPGATPSDAIDALAAEAARTGKPSQPNVAWDLDEKADPGSTVQRAAAAPIAAASSETGDDESDWRFEDEMPELGDSGASLDLPNGEAPAAEPDPNESSFAQLGDPESWDLLSTTSSDIQPTSRTLIGGLQAAPIRGPDRPDPVVVPLPEPVSQTPVRREEPPAISEPVVVPMVEPTRGMRVAGFAATALLSLLALAGGLRAPTSGATTARHAALGRLTVDGAAARLVDNAWAGPVWVVSGQIRNATSEPQRIEAAVAVVLLDRSGAPLDGAVALAQPSLGPAALRGEDPIALRDRATASAAALASRAIEPGASVAFDAVFPTASRAAVRFAVESRPLPLTPAPEAAAPRLPAPALPLEAPSPTS